MSELGQYSTFFVDRCHFGIEVASVQEALRPLPTTPVPLTTEVVDGLVNLRGQIVMAIDLRARLGMPRRAESDPRVSLILRTASGLISLRVDQLGDVLACRTSAAAASDRSTTARGRLTVDRGNDAAAMPLESLPDTVHGPLRQIVRGVLQLEDSLLMILDPDLLADPAVCVGEEVTR